MLRCCVENKRFEFMKLIVKYYEKNKISIEKIMKYDKNTLSKLPMELQESIEKLKSLQQ